MIPRSRQRSVTSFPVSQGNGRKPTLMLRVPKAPRARSGKDGRDKIRRSAAQSAVADVDRELFQALRQKRMEIARTQNVPPYVIFHDKTLIELAAARPASRAEMADVPGVGEAKLDRYGPAFPGGDRRARITRWPQDDRGVSRATAFPLGCS
jgi:superfamily II DNA helicase RecQ